MDFLLFKMLARVGLIGFDPRMGFFPWGSAGGKASYKVQRSVRLRRSANGFFNRVFPTAGDRTKFTVSAWVKRAQIGVNNTILMAGNTSSNFNYMAISGEDRLTWQINIGGSEFLRLNSTRVLRDPSAWYHVMFVYDTTLAAQADRARIYLNGERITSFSTNTNFLGSLQTTEVNNNVNHIISNNTIAAGDGIDGNLAEYNFVGGQALEPSAFAEQDTATRMWVPKRYTGTYGTNGFYLDFSDITSTTTLGYDKSGNNNHWTANNISLTVGATYDSMLDVPGLPWGDRGNYCTLNPLDQDVSNATSNANLSVTTSTAGQGFQRGTVFVSSGKWYWEVVPTSISGNSSIGIAGVNTTSSTANYIGSTADSYGYIASNGNKYNNNNNAAYGATYTTNDVIGVALDMDAGTLVFYKNNVSQGTAYSSLSGSFAPALSDVSNTLQSAFNVNFGQRPFAYTPPAGFKALHTGNLPTPTGAAAKPWEHFDAVIYAGSASNLTISGRNFQPDLFWFKERTTTGIGHALYDIVRNNYAGKLETNSTAAEAGGSPFTAVSATQYTLIGGNSNTNDTFGRTYVNWLWKAGGAPVTNNAGSITSQVSANTAAGFSIVTFTAPASGAFTVGHGLGVPPKLIIEKQRGNTGTWNVFFSGVTSKDQYLYLHTADAIQPAANGWGSALPTSSVFGMTAGVLVGSNNTQVAYCFAEVPGFSKIGSYVGNGSANGPFVYCGFKPRFILIKRVDSSGGWVLFDTARDTFNEMNDELAANSNAAEASPFSQKDSLSNGFKIRNTQTDHNANGGSYIFYAVAEAPFQYANAR